MRKINKTDSPKNLVKQKETCNNNWNNVSSKDKGNWRACLLQEQQGFDAYTEELLSKNQNVIHIDHFKKRDHYSELTFDWNNLFLANHKNDYGADAKDQNKQLQYDCLIHPANEEPHDYFTYNSRGEILPKADLDNAKKQKAEFTIKIFKLNAPILVGTRESILQTLRNYKDQIKNHNILSSLNNQPFPSLIESYIREELS